MKATIEITWTQSQSALHYIACRWEPNIRDVGDVELRFNKYGHYYTMSNHPDTSYDTLDEAKAALLKEAGITVVSE